jgi:molybdenum cofactor cytidylyltransferase
MIAALVPAAGSSSRLGQPKLLLKFDEQTLIGALVRSLRKGGAGRIVVVAPPADTAEGPPIASEARLAGADVVVPLTRPAQMRDSIELGLARLALGDVPRSVLLTPGDCPGIEAGLVEQLVKRGAAVPDRILIPTHNGRRGHPIVLPWTIAATIHSLPLGVGVNALVAQHAGSVVEIEVANAELVADLDTPADLKRWEQRRNPDRVFRVNVRLFALARDRAARSEVEIELLSGSRVADLRAALIEQLPALLPLLPTVMIAVDEEYAGDDVPITPASRLAVIPPVSGGAGEGR